MSAANHTTCNQEPITQTAWRFYTLASLRAHSAPLVVLPPRRAWQTRFSQMYNVMDLQDELLNAEKYLKKSLEMLFIEPGNSPEGELCAKALEEYRALKATMNSVLDAIHAEGKAYVSAVDEEESNQVLWE